MAGFLLNEAAVKVKSEELHIPFSNLLPAAIVEYMLSCLSESEYSDKLWLKNSSSLGLESYRRKPIFTLSFYYDSGRDGTLSTARMEEVLRFLIIKYQEKEMKLTASLTVIEEEKKYQADLIITMGMMEVPITLRAELLEDAHMQSYEGELRLFMQNNHVIHFLQYPSEQVLAECFVTMLEKMELINDLSVYHDFYAIAKKESIDGRRVQQQIADIGKKRELMLRTERFQKILGYRDYTYMKKKWKTYLKREKKTSPSWEEVINLVERFYAPLYAAVTEDSIFLGDWMPELMRYLD